MKFTLKGVKKLANIGEFIDFVGETPIGAENQYATELLIVTENQSDNYFGEQDIVRLDADFARN